MLRTIQTLEGMEHHEPSGMFYNWYDEATGDAIRAWPGTGATVHPFVSSVDNGWLGAALLVVSTADRVAGPRAKALFERMHWDAFYNPGDGADGHPVVRTGGLMHGGFFVFDHDRPGGVYRGTHIGGEDVWLTGHHYDTFNTEPRITSYLGIVDRADARQALLRHLAHLPGDAATGHGPRRSRSGRPAPTSGSTCTRAPTPTAACRSSPAGAAACSRR